MQTFTNQLFFQHLLIDSNEDGYIDGIATAIVPLATDTATPALWAAMANLAARLGLEAPAIHLPLVIDAANIQPWQFPLFLSWGNHTAESLPLSWQCIDEEAVSSAQDGLQITWVTRDGQRGLWVHGHEPQRVAAWLNQLATAASEQSITHHSQPPTSAQPLDLAQLYTCQIRANEEDQGTESASVFHATHDGFMPDDCRLTLLLGPEIDATAGVAAVHLAARLGLETAGLTLPLAAASDEPPTDTQQQMFLLGFPTAHTASSPSSMSPAFHIDANATQHQLSAPVTDYLATVYPFLNQHAQQTDDEQQTVQAILETLRGITQAHTPLAKLALAEVQAGHSLHLMPPRAQGTESLRRVVFQQVWSPADGLDDPQRVYATFRTGVIPALEQEDAEPPTRITLFCNAPATARTQLAERCSAAIATLGMETTIHVLPVHKAGLTWLLETQLPSLQQAEVTHVKLHFREFRTDVSTQPVLDLPTRWLQELFPADELLANALGLSLEQVTAEMMAATDTAAADQPLPPTYRLEAFNAAGELVHHDELHLLSTERLYMSGLAQFGRIHPTSGGIIVQNATGNRRVWPVPTDDLLFWDFYQESVLPALRHHVVAGSGGRPLPEREPYFDRLDVHVSMGAPDQPLGIYEEFISLGEALHEDIYFNTLDYFAALGEAFTGQSIAAAGQVVPWVHDYYGHDGNPIDHTAPRATITLTDWAVPCTLPTSGLTVGDRRDMPLPIQTRVTGIAVAADGSSVRELTIALTYADQKQARFAGNVLAQWQKLAEEATGFPAAVALTVDCSVGTQKVKTVTFSTTTAKEPARPSTLASHAPVVSDIIGPQQLEDELAALTELPGIRVWEVGRSYQGRPGHVVDVTLPVDAHQTHIARHKLALQKPTLFFVARHHANEVSSTTSVLQMARDAASNTESAVHQWLKKVNLVLLPMANPDGAAIHYDLMAEHPHWKHHAARFNAAGKEFGSDHFNENTPFGEARFRRGIWERWLPDAIVDNHGVPSHEWCQPFAGYTTPPRFPVCYHVVQAMLYGIITYVNDPTQPQWQQNAAALRAAVADAVAATPWLHERNQYWLNRYHRFGHQWLPELSPINVHNDMLFFYRGVAPPQLPSARRNFAMRYPQITLLDWITEVPDETAQSDYLAECAAAHRVANEAMIQLLAESAAPVQRVVEERGDGRVWVGLRRERQIKSVCK